MKYKFLILFFSISMLSTVSSAILTKVTITKPSTTIVSPVKSIQSTTVKPAVVSTTGVITPPVIIDTTDNVVYDEVQPNFNPIVTFTADGDDGSTTIEYGTSTIIEWATENAKFCTEPYIENVPNYGKQLTDKTSGTFKTQNLTQQQTFFINCKDLSGLFNTKSIVVNVERQLAPTVTIMANENEKSTDIEYGASTTIAWESTDTSSSSCNMISFWATSTNFISTSTQEQNSVLPAGQVSSGNLFLPKIFTLSCKNDSGVATSSILVNVIPQDPSSDLVIKTEQTSSCVTLTKNIRYGSRDSDTEQGVSTLQTFLSDHDFYKNEVSGFDGIGTTLAVKLFQKKEGLPATGFVGRMTREKIKEISCGNN